MIKFAVPTSKNIIPPNLVENLYKSDGPYKLSDFHDSVIFQKTSGLKNIVNPMPMRMIDKNIIV